MTLPLRNLSAWLLLLIGALLATPVLVSQHREARFSVDPPPPAAILPPAAPRYVTGLGRVEPIGELRRLDAPSGAGGVPRVAQLLVQEGATVRQGELLALFDNNARLKADLAAQNAQTTSLKQRHAVAQDELNRYLDLESLGVVTPDAVDARERRSLSLEGEYLAAQARAAAIQADMLNSELRAPFDGTVLEILAWEGERPRDGEGVLELGRTDSMAVIAEIYETDIGRIAVGQPALIQAEHGGFSGSLRGRVERIGLKISRRDVLSTDPTEDVDARVVEVQIALDPEASLVVGGFSRMQVLVRIDTQDEPAGTAPANRPSRSPDPSPANAS